jgi:hypothetical protein
LGLELPLKETLRHGQDLSADDIHSHLSQHFVKWHLPKVIVTDAVKRNSVEADARRV